jgi:hypothetical protein
MDKNKLVNVRNRNNGSTGYFLADARINRTWQPNEVKQISLGELESLQWEPGGDYILKNLLVVEDAEVVKDLNMQVEPEYFYTEEEIRKVLFEGSLDALLDFLDFAPEGAIEVIKHIAVNEELPDTRKREAISKHTGFNIDTAIQINRMMEEPAEETATEKPVENGGRRVTKGKYNVVSMNK